MSEATMTTQEVLAFVGVKRTTLYVTLMGKLNFPKPRKIGLRDNVWTRSEVENWMNERMGKKVATS